MEFEKEAVHNTFQDIQIELEYTTNVHTFERYHGHNIVDSHFSAIKKKLRERFSETFISSKRGIEDVIASLEKTTHISLDGLIDVSLQPSEDQIERIREYRHFSIQREGKVICQHLFYEGRKHCYYV